MSRYIASVRDIKPVAYIARGKSKDGVTILFNSVPKNYGECELYINSATFDEFSCWGDCVVRRCPFGCSNWGCLV